MVERSDALQPLARDLKRFGSGAPHDRDSGPHRPRTRPGPRPCEPDQAIAAHDGSDDGSGANQRRISATGRGRSNR